MNSIVERAFAAKPKMKKSVPADKGLSARSSQLIANS